MRTADYIDILNVSARACGLEPDNLDTLDFQALRDFHSNRLSEASEFQRWPELERTEKRYFRLLYDSATTYAAPSLTVAVERYFPATGKYYQTLVESTGEDPADSAGATNLAFWAESAVEYSADPYDSTRVYVLGEIAYFPTTDRYYQLYTATSTGNAPSDAANWGVLTEFDRVVEYAQTGQTALGQIFEVWDANPKPNFRAAPVNYELSNNGIQVMDEVPWVYVVFRIRIPLLQGNAYDATAIYAVGQQIYFSSATTRGNFYTRINEASEAGESPDTDEGGGGEGDEFESNWAVVEIPLLFDRYLKHAGAGDWLAADDRNEAAVAQFALADQSLSNQGLLLTGQQGQNQRTNILTR